MDGFAIEMVAILTPGMIGGWRFRELEVMIEGFGLHDFSLARGFVIDGVS